MQSKRCCGRRKEAISLWRSFLPPHFYTTAVIPRLANLSYVCVLRNMHAAATCNYCKFYELKCLLFSVVRINDTQRKKCFQSSVYWMFTMSLVLNPRTTEFFSQHIRNQPPLQAPTTTTNKLNYWTGQATLTPSHLET